MKIIIYFLCLFLSINLSVFAQKTCDELEKKAFATENPQEALSLWEKIATMDCPNKMKAINNRGMLYFETFDDLDSALIEFDKALVLDPNSYEVLINKASLMSSMKKQNTAIDILKKAIGIKPQIIDGHVMLGVIYARNENFENAITSLDNALKIDSTHFESLNNRFRVHEAMNDDSAALLDITLLVTRNPKLANAWSNKGHYYMSKQENDSAIVYFTKAIQLNPQDYRNYVNRGMCNGKEGNTEMELDDYAKSILIYPNYLAFYNRGRIFLKRGDYEKAITENNKVIELDPEFAGAYLNKGNAFYKMERFKEAIECYKKGLNCRANRDTKGKLEYQLKSATELLKK